MSAYVIVDIHITDPGRYEKYKQLAAPTVAAFGGRYLVRGGTAEALEGEGQPGRTVVLEFPSVDRAREWWHSNEYAEAKAIRQACARTRMIIAEGIAP